MQQGKSEKNILNIIREENRKSRMTFYFVYGIEN